MVPAAVQPLGQHLGFTICLASRDGYEDSVLRAAYPRAALKKSSTGACGLYLDHPTAWLQPPTN